MTRGQPRGRTRSARVPGTRFLLHVVPDLGGPDAVRIGRVVFVVDTGDRATAADVARRLLEDDASCHVGEID
jgi:hypothetical protein